MVMALQLFVACSGFPHCELLVPILCEHPGDNYIYGAVHVHPLPWMNGKVTFGKASLFAALVTEEQFTHQRVSCPHRFELFNKPLLKKR